MVELGCLGYYVIRALKKVFKLCLVLGGRVAAHNREGLVVSASIQNAVVCLDETASSDVWVAVSDDSGCPFVALRHTMAVECTGLGGADLRGPNPWDLLVRTGCHHEEVYGPSLARLEDARVVNQCNVQYVGLGLTKASHEFLMLHYFATDSFQIWDDLDSLAEIVFPHAPSRRAHAYHAFLAAHIAPSYRRLAHPLWSSCMSLILRLCTGLSRSQIALDFAALRKKPAVPVYGTGWGGAHQSVSSSPTGDGPSSVPLTALCDLRVWGFSAGSFSGLAVLDLLAAEPLVRGFGTFGALACPPELLARFSAPQAQRIAIYHYGPDKLCQWFPYDQDVESSPFRVAYVRNFDNNMDRHFGKSEHSYSHWLWLDIAPGIHKLWALCRDHRGAAVPAARDEAPLRLVSWLSFRPSTQCQRFIQEAMDALSAKHMQNLVALGQHAFPSACLPDADSLRELLLSEISLAGMTSPPTAVRELFETFLRQIQA